MKSLQLAFTGCLLAAAATLFACQKPNLDEDLGSDTAHVEAVDPLEGAYAKQGGTPLHFVFRRGDAQEEDVFFGEIEIDGQAQRAEGTVVVGRDKLGTTLTLTPKGAAKTKKKDAGAPNADGPEADADGGASEGGAGAESPADTRPLAEQAFTGTVHFLKIGKNDTLLVRGDENGKTAQYKKLKTWCGINAEDDCRPSVQRTGLTCANVICTTSDKCACGE